MRQVGIGGIAALVGVLGTITCSYQLREENSQTPLHTVQRAVDQYNGAIVVHERNLSHETTLGTIADNYLFLLDQSQDTTAAGEMLTFSVEPTVYAIPTTVCYETTNRDDFLAVSNIYSEKLDPSKDREFVCRIEYLSPV